MISECHIPIDCNIILLIQIKFIYLKIHQIILNSRLFNKLRLVIKEPKFSKTESVHIGLLIKKNNLLCKILKYSLLRKFKNKLF